MNNKYDPPSAIMFNVSPSDIITTSPSDSGDYSEPGVELPEVVFPRNS